MTCDLAVVLDKFEDVIEFAVENNEPFGYFAVIHHAATSAVNNNLGAFEDVERIHRFIELFAGRYLAAVGAYLTKTQAHRGRELPGWAGVFDHDLTVMESVWDLGFILAEIGQTPQGLAAFRRDFAVFYDLALPVFPRAWGALDEIVPRVRWMRRAMTPGFWPWLFNHFRDRSWRFAEQLLARPENKAKLCERQLAYTHTIERRWRKILPLFAAGESRDTAANILRLKEAMR
jgi:hypothetical protein